ncbi:hypothetical protein K6V98_07950 [Collinsella sp. AGMB00827]|uniref:Uncharacterized protein n=1 Tax=Collinsella ureilytica TaxID=2869515 RepID=A0ABS7MMJ5_9ACTN|nr:hypothetical protein [Collinsella urealyticum]MBY4798276.1 hypothetical protein [Collinsella urealyticum]
MAGFTLKVASINDKGQLEDGKTDYYTYEPINDAVDFDISGKDYILHDAYMIIRLPRTFKLYSISFVDSQVGTTERGQTATHTYIRYNFPTLTGGFHSTYPVSLRINGNYAAIGESFPLEVAQYDSTGKELAKTERVYTAKWRTYESFSVSQGISGAKSLASDRITAALDGVEVGTTQAAIDSANGHRRVADLVVDDLNATTIESPITSSVQFTATVVPISGINSGWGMSKETRLKTVMTLPPGVVAKNLKEGVQSETLPDGSTRLTYIGKPFMSFFGSSASKQRPAY